MRLLQSGKSIFQLSWNSFGGTFTSFSTDIYSISLYYHLHFQTNVSRWKLQEQRFQTTDSVGRKLQDNTPATCAVNFPAQFFCRMQQWFRIHAIVEIL